jgi:hypothetical protein
MSFNKNEFTVTRQCQYPEGTLVVEISQGGSDYSNPGMLVKAYPEEGDTFLGMTNAVEAGIRIAQQWKKDSKKKIGIAVGNTGGDTAFFESMPLTIATFKHLRKKAYDFDINLPRCDRCGEILGKDKYRNNEMPDDLFCREYCAEEAYRELCELDTQDESEDDD